MFTRIVECYAKAGAWNTTRSGRTRRWATGRRHRKLSCQSNRGMEIWKTLRVSHIPTPPATTTDNCLTRRYTNIPLGTKDRSGHCSRPCKGLEVVQSDTDHNYGLPKVTYAVRS